MQTSSSQKLLNMSHGGKILPNLTISRRIKNDQMEHKHCRRIAAVIPGCEGKHSIALLLERCSRLNIIAQRLMLLVPHQHQPFCYDI